MEAVINTANTSHILQPSDLLINKIFQELMREMREEFNRQGCVDTTRVNLNLACAVNALSRISPVLVQASFKITGTFTFQRNFADQYKKYKDDQQERVEVEAERLDNATVASRLPAVRQRQTDQEVFNTIIDIIGGNKGVPSKIEDIQILLKKQETVNAILMVKIKMKTADPLR